MQRINSTNARPDVNGIGKHGFHSNEDLPGQDATYLTPTWLNAIQEELSNLLELHSIQLDPNDNAQLYGLLATDTDLLALSEAVEQRIQALAAITATKSGLNQAIDYVSANLQQHKDAKNPHPQYLLATTFGVDLPMTANVHSTPIEDANRIYGWNGETGDTGFSIGTVSWWKRGSGTFTFKPWRSYGRFLLWFNFQPQGDGYVYVKTYSKDGVLIKEQLVSEVHRAAYNVYEDPIKYVFELPQGGYAEITYNLYVWNKHKGGGNGSIYVDDRPKSFSPVGYTSTVDYSNDSGIDDVGQEDGYSVYPTYEWFYYTDATKSYTELNPLATFENPAMRVPHYHRNNFTDISDIDIWCIVEVGKQTIELPNSDYIAVDVQVVRCSVDENGDVVQGIPFEMRSIETPNNETLVYTVAYYASEVTKTVTETDFPDNSLNGKHVLYVRP